mmetsp:Transcript_33384/g.73544  ORF Transcript_33384/g.73544 Transcript_33384/m.73544 type:complete len:215 (-) Transcript_33384:719-1363(-)
MYAYSGERLPEARSSNDASESCNVTLGAGSSDRPPAPPMAVWKTAGCSPGFRCSTHLLVLLPPLLLVTSNATRALSLAAIRVTLSGSLAIIACSFSNSLSLGKRGRAWVAVEVEVGVEVGVEDVGAMPDLAMSCAIIISLSASAADEGYVCLSKSPTSAHRAASSSALATPAPTPSARAPPMATPPDLCSLTWLNQPPPTSNTPPVVAQLSWAR